MGALGLILEVFESEVACVMRLTWALACAALIVL